MLWSRWHFHSDVLCNNMNYWAVCSGSGPLVLCWIAYLCSSWFCKLSEKCIEKVLVVSAARSEYLQCMTASAAWRLLGTGPLSIDVTGLRSALGWGGCCCCCWPGHLWSPAPTFGCIIGTTTHQEANIWLKHFAVFGLQNIANYSLNWKAARSGHWEVSCLLGS